VGVLTAVFVASRIGYYLAGVRFDATPLGRFWQYLDPQLLEHDLLASVWHLHSQPPLFNLFLGWTVQLSPGTWDSPATAAIFATLFHLLGLGIYLGTHTLMRRLGASFPVALLCSALVVLRPGFVLFENWLLYDVPVTALLVLSALLLHRAFQAPPRSWAMHGFFWTVAALSAARSFFHLVFFVATAMLVTVLWRRSGAISPSRPRRRRLPLPVVAALVPATLLVALYTKNLVLFDQFGVSSWFGMNLARVATSAVPEETLEALVRSGELSPAGAVPPFSTLDRYPVAHRQGLRYPDVPALAEAVKSTGAPNYNHEAYLRISRSALHDALWLVRHRPGAYLGGVARALYNFTKPPGEIRHGTRNRRQVEGLLQVTDTLLYGALPGAFHLRGEARTLYLFPLLLLPALCLYGIHRARREDDPAHRALLLYLLLTLAYVATVGNLFEVWENGRFRFYVDPFFAVLAALGLQAALGKSRKKFSVVRRWISS
jgi:4-amino-4-deoxy-L-arabinose transferase-like glycosyltransferase